MDAANSFMYPGQPKKVLLWVFGLYQKPFGQMYLLQHCPKDQLTLTSSSCVPIRSPWSLTTCPSTSMSWSLRPWPSTFWHENSPMCVGKSLLRAVPGRQICPMAPLLGTSKPVLNCWLSTCLYFLTITRCYCLYWMTCSNCIGKTVQPFTFFG